MEVLKQTALNAQLTLTSKTQPLAVALLVHQIQTVRGVRVREALAVLVGAGQGTTVSTRIGRQAASVALLAHTKTGQEMEVLHPAQFVHQVHQAVGGQRKQPQQVPVAAGLVITVFIQLCQPSARPAPLVLTRALRAMERLPCVPHALPTL